MMGTRIETGTCDLAVIGAGPAGMAAAMTAAELGLSVTLIDEQPAPGGQIYRNALDNPRAESLGPDYGHGVDLARAFAAAKGIERLMGATVWLVTPEGKIGIRTDDGTMRQVKAKAVVLATGALERPMPFPGWTLPGVMTAGAGQILLKTAGVVPADGVVLAGSGPLLYLAAVQFLDAGVKPGAIVETTPASNYLKAARHWTGALSGMGTLFKGLKLLARLRAARVPMVSGATGLKAVAGGDGAVARLTYSAGGSVRTVDCRLLLIHQGVVPNVQISRALDIPHDWDDLQRCWRPHLGPWGDTGLERIFIAGDGGGIGGAGAAEEQGRLAALAAATAIARIGAEERDRRARGPRRVLRRLLAVRPFLDALYRPADDAVIPPDDTVVCRCEEITAAEVRRCVADGCFGPNQVKSFARPGMGPCQGRMCGLTVAEIIAKARGVPVAEVGYYRLRPPYKPLEISDLAKMEEAEE